MQPSGQRGEPDQTALSTSTRAEVHFAHRQGEDLRVRDDQPTGASTSPQAREPKAEPFRPHAHSFQAERVHGREAVELRLSAPDIGEQKLGRRSRNCLLWGNRALANNVQSKRRDCDRTPTHGYEATREAAITAFAKSWRRE